MKNTLKSQLQKNFAIYWIGRKVRIFLQIVSRILNGFYFIETYNALFKGTQINGFGEIKIALNVSVPYERKLIYDKGEELNWVHGMKLFVNEGQKIYFINPPSAFMPVFFAKMIKNNVFIKTKSENKFKFDLERNNVANVEFISENEYLDADLVFIFGDNDYVGLSNGIVFNVTQRTSLKVENNKNMQKNVDGRFFPLDYQNQYDQFVSYFIIKPNDYQEKKINLSVPKKISGATYLRSPEIYPFDLCYQSVLNVVDEFIFGLDDILQTHNEVEILKRNQIIEKFMDDLTPQDRAKIRFSKFDFKARFNKNLNIPAKWLVDVSNSLLDKCSYETVCFVQADEMYHENNYEQILEFSRQDDVLALKHEFLHFVFDLKQIRNPETVAYTHAIRVFKKDCYSCTGDGYSFISLRGRNDLLREYVSKYPIYHLGYVIDFRKKMEAHLAEGGLFDFKDKKVDTDAWIDKADVVPYEGFYPKFLFLENKISSEKIKFYTSKIN